jgi:hypothetical protein
MGLSADGLGDQLSASKTVNQAAESKAWRVNFVNPSAPLRAPFGSAPSPMRMNRRATLNTLALLVALPSAAW